MEDNILRIENLSHRYTSTWAIRDINLEVGRRGIVGLLGANGAGKSTTMNILCGSLRQTDGNIYIDGIDMAKDPVSAKKHIGFLPQVAPLHLDLTVDEYLVYCAGLRDIAPKAIPEALGYVKDRCGITHFSKRLLRNLSGGYRQRVGIAQAIIHRPDLVVLDEPTNGLDPNQIIEIRSLIKEIATAHSVILSTHVLSEVQVMCNDIRMIDAGRIVFADSMEAFNNYMSPHSVIMQLQQPPTTERLLAEPGITRVDFLTERQLRLYFDGGRHSEGDIIQRLVAASVSEDWQLLQIGPDKNSLDEIFAELSNHHQKINRS